jgi:hypothetical protein
MRQQNKLARRSAWMQVSITLPYMLALATVLWLLPSSVRAQQLRYTISGKVLESATRQPVAGATVRIDNTVLGTPTDPNGNFTLTATLQPGNYTLSVSYIGYKPKQVRFTLGDNNQCVWKTFCSKKMQRVRQKWW